MRACAARLGSLLLPLFVCRLSASLLCWSLVPSVSPPVRWLLLPLLNVVALATAPTHGMLLRSVSVCVSSAACARHSQPFFLQAEPFEDKKRPRHPRHQPNQRCNRQTQRATQTTRTDRTGPRTHRADPSGHHCDRPAVRVSISRSSLRRTSSLSLRATGGWSWRPLSSPAALLEAALRHRIRLTATAGRTLIAALLPHRHSPLAALRSRTRTSAPFPLVRSRSAAAAVGWSAAQRSAARPLSPTPADRQRRPASPSPPLGAAAMGSSASKSSMHKISWAMPSWCLEDVSGQRDSALTKHDKRDETRRRPSHR